MSDRSVNSATFKPSSKSRRRLAPSEKYEIFVSVLTGQATQREAALKWKGDRSTVTHICQVAKRGALDALSASVLGRPGMTAEAAELAAVSAGSSSAMPSRCRTIGLGAGPPGPVDECVGRHPPG
jgi:hypothetical protein